MSSSSSTKSKEDYDRLVDQAIAEVKTSRAYIKDLEKQLALTSTSQQQLAARLSTEQDVSSKLQQELDAVNVQITLLTQQRDAAKKQLAACEDDRDRLIKERDKTQGRVGFWRRVSAAEAAIIVVVVTVTVLANKGG